jgi:hypothetical protein
VKGTASHFNYGSIEGVNLGSSQGTTVEYVHFAAFVVNYSANGLDSGVQSIIRHNIFTDNASPNFACPSLVEGNVNQTGDQGGSGTGCVYVNNVGVFNF